RRLRVDGARRVRPAGAPGRVRPLRRTPLPARRRSRRDGPPPDGRVRTRDGPGPRPLPDRRAAARDRRDGDARRRVPPCRGERRMILLKSKDEIEHMRAANGIVAGILAEIRARVRAGVTTAELDALAEELTLKRGARPAFKGYTVAGRVFPASICISINDE